MHAAFDPLGVRGSTFLAIVTSSIQIYIRRKFTMIIRSLPKAVFERSNTFIYMYVNQGDSLFLIHYKNSNSISSRCIFWCVFVAIIWSNQVKMGIMFFKTAVNCKLAVPVPNLLAMCEQ